jgi:hypothetical protein
MPEIERWADLYRKFVAEAAYPDKLKERLAALEYAIAVRLEALGNRADCQYERVAIQGALNVILEIKITKLGFSPVLNETW